MIARLFLLLTLLLALVPAAVAHEHGAAMSMPARHVTVAPVVPAPVSLHSADAVLTAATVDARVAPCGTGTADACAAICAIACLAVIDDTPATVAFRASPLGVAAPAADLVAIPSAPPTPPPRG